MNTPIRRRVLASACLGTLLAVAGLASAQEAWPGKPIKIIVPFPAGSATDSAARVVGNRMAQLLKQSFVIDNRGGASGYIAAEAVKNAPADGYTLLFGTASTQAVSVALNPALSFNPEKDFAAVGLIGTSPYILVASANSGIKSVADLIQRARSKPGELTYASAGNTSMANLAAQLFATTSKVQLSHVPYKTSAQAVTDTVSGIVDLQFGTVAPVIPFVRSGTLTALAVTGPVRLPLLPQVPTVSEAGLPGYEAGLWMGLFAPRATPPAVLDKLASALRSTLEDASVVAAINAQGIQILPGTRDDLSELVKTEIVKWTKVTKEAGIKAD
jgi:tripartite-type tricarboxylate transporter receptor subunit TctC